MLSWIMGRTTKPDRNSGVLVAPIANDLNQNVSRTGVFFRRRILSLLHDTWRKAKQSFVLRFFIALLSPILLFPSGCYRRAIECFHYLAFDLFLPRHRRFTYRTGSLADLQSLLRVHRAALAAVPMDHPRRRTIVRNFGVDLSLYFRLVGNMEDLLESIRALRQALSLQSAGDPDRVETLTWLASDLQRLFVLIQRPEILDESIDYARQAIDCSPPADPSRWKALSTLSEGLRISFTQRGRDTCDESVAKASQAAALCPPGHSERNLALQQLSIALSARYQQRKKLDDLEESTTKLRESLTLVTGVRNLARPEVMHSLVLNLWAHYDHTRRQEDVLELRGYADSIDTTLQQYASYPVMTLLWSALAPVYFLDPDPGMHARGQTLFQRATEHGGSSALHRLGAAVGWLGCARFTKHSSTELAYSAALRLVDECLVTRPSVEWQRELLVQTAGYSLPASAASYMIEQGELEKAVEMLEQGRARLWSTLRGYTPPVDIEKIRAANPELADRLTLDLDTLRGLALTHIKDLPAFRPAPTPSVESAFEYVLAGQQNTLLDLAASLRAVRETCGIDEFQGVRPYAYLAQAAAEGPVIIVNVTAYRADAIVLRHGCAPVAIPLAADLEKQVGRLSRGVDKLVETSRGARGTRFVRLAGSLDMVAILRLLWGLICEPVVDHLLASGVEEQSRIWWCPTGALGLLPLHAAGPHVDGARNMSDIFISSYAPTLASLIVARSTPNQAMQGGTRLLAVGQSQVLPQVKAELSEIQEIFKPHADATVDVLDTDGASPAQVLDALHTHPWVHFACHGAHRPAQPFTSAFLLHGGALSLMDIARARLPAAELAVLAACHSAAGDARGAADEALSLAAALQFGGFRGVVGTLWVMDDGDGPALARDFYAEMARGGRDFRGAAGALQRAVGALRARGVPAERWCTFVHIGA